MDTTTYLETPFFSYDWKFGYVYCLTIIWHPNIASWNPYGRANFTMGDSWNPDIDLASLINGLKDLIHMRFNPFYALDTDAALQYLDKKDDFNIKAKKWTRKYAHNGVD